MAIHNGKRGGGANKKGVYQWTPAEFEARANAYFDACKSSGEPITTSGLALALEFGCLKTIKAYQEREGYENIVSRARMRVQHAYECRLHGSNPTGAIFALKNMGWSDKIETEHSGELVVKWQDGEK